MFKNERRVFRGRGGPTDRRLPKHNARRRRRHPAAQEEPPIATSSNDGRGTNSPRAGTAVYDAGCKAGVLLPNDSVSREAAFSVEDAVVVLPSSLHRREDSNDLRHLPSHPPHAEIADSNISVGLVSVEELATATAESCSFDHDRAKYRAEVEHLQQRVRNNQLSMSMMRGSASTPKSSLSSISVNEHYQRHVLDAVRNTIREFRSIVRRYHRDGCEGENDSAQQQREQDRKRLGTEIFGLAQQALQCGPLAGSKAGYMKRCPPEVADRVLRFLRDAFPEDDDEYDDSRDSGSRSRFAAAEWTEKQKQAVRSWKRNAERAAVVISNNE